MRCQISMGYIYQYSITPVIQLLSLILDFIREALFRQGHSSGQYLLACFDTVDVHSCRGHFAIIMTTVPANTMGARGFLCVSQCPDELPLDIVDFDRDVLGILQRVIDDGLGIKRIGTIVGSDSRITPFPPVFSPSCRPCPRCGGSIPHVLSSS